MKRWLRRALARVSGLAARVMLFSVVLLLGVVAFELGRSEPWVDPLDSLYRSLQLFALAFERPGDPAFVTTPLLRLVQFLAPAVTVLSVISILSGSFSNYLRLHLQRYSDRRAVLLGFGAVNRAIARHLDKSGWTITAVDLSFNAADHAFAQRHGTLLLAANLNDPKSLERARIADATRIIVSCGGDASGVEVAKLATAFVSETRRSGNSIKEPSPRVDVHVATSSTVRTLNDLEDGGYRAFSLKTEAARSLVRQARFLEFAHDLGAKRAHIAIVGVGELGEAILAEAVQTAISGSVPPKFTLIDQDISAVRVRLEARFPSLFGMRLPEEVQPDFDWKASSAEAVAEVYDVQDPPTAWVFSCRDDDTNLAASAQLESAMRRLVVPPVPIFARLWHVRSDFGLTAARPDRLTRAFGDLLSATEGYLRVSPEVEAMAKAIHAAYLDEKAITDLHENDPEAYDSYWEALPETARQSNCAAARHLVDKARALGFDWCGREQGRLPRLPSNDPIHQDLEAAMTRPETLIGRLRDIAKVEHGRWMMERALSGWAAPPKGEPRSNRRRLHDNMVAFETLEQEIRALDLTALGVLARNDDPNAPLAKARAVHQTDLRTFAKSGAVAVSEEMTELHLTIPSDTIELSHDIRKAVDRATKKLVKERNLMRLVIRIEGDTDLRLEAPDDTHANAQPTFGTWMGEIKARFAGAIFDVIYAP